MLLLVAFVMFAMLTVAWLVMPDQPAVPATVAKTETRADPAIVPARA